MKKLTSDVVLSPDISYSFASANSAFGFFSKYGEIFNTSDFERLYILKGGPGTGKSSFLRRLGEHAHDTGYSVEYFLCSSDPDSLDGVIWEKHGKKYGMLDGTAPHTKDADIPGAVAQLVDLGAFWDQEKLGKYRDVIIEGIAAKKTHYDNSYLYLSAAGKVEESIAAASASAFDSEKASHSVKVIFDKYAKKDSCAKITTRIRRAYSTKGKFETKAAAPWKMLYKINDPYSSGKLFMKLVLNEALKRGHSVIVSYAPLDTSPDLVYIPKFGIGFEISDNTDYGDKTKNINMWRFLDRCALADMRSSLRRVTKLRDSLIDEALCELSLAGEEHFALEDIYVDSMDFKALEKFARDFLKKNII